MNLAIIHLTDIHFSKDDLTNKFASIISILKNEIEEYPNIYIVISGDITNTGKAIEFEIARKQLKLIKSLLTSQKNDINIKFIISAGNHDCDFDNEIFLRKTNVKSLNYEKLGDDSSLIDLCTEIQSPFWDFYKEFNSAPDDKLFYSIIDTLGKHEIAFYCLNTAFCSTLTETPGSLFFPVKRVEKGVDVTNKRLSVAVYHHPTNWFNPNLEINNKREMQEFLQKISVIQFCGHEHEDSTFALNEVGYKKDNFIFEGRIFNDNIHDRNSGFQILKIDLDSLSGKIDKYEWRDTFFDLIKESDVNLLGSEIRTFTINDIFYKNLNELKIPLNIGEKRNIKLDQIYVYPDVERIQLKGTSRLDDYFDSKKILSDDKYNYSIFEGESQVGRSSFLSICFIHLYENGLFPLFISGKDVKDFDTTKILKKAYEDQYQSKDAPFEKFRQSDKSIKILLIDDINEIKLNIKSIKEMMCKFADQFSKVYITIDSSSSVMMMTQLETDNYQHLKILPFGFKKRNDLILKYHYLKGNDTTGLDNHIITEAQISFEDVQSILGNKLIPPLPVYVLSILQSLDYKSLQLNETSFGYCYQTLIHYSLFRVGIKNEDLGDYINFLSELAFEFIKKDIESMDEHEFENFYNAYKQKYIITNFNRVSENLKRSKLIIEENATITFGYKYILFYLSAKKISDIIHTDGGKKIITKLFEDFHKEKNANILVFVTHHSKDISFIEQSMLSSMMVLDQYPAITLSKDDEFYKKLENIALESTNSFINPNINYKQERNKQLDKLDEEERNRIITDQNEQEFTSPDQIVLPLIQSFRSIEIVGQIIKNRKGSLEINSLKEMIKELYTTGFRTIFYSSEILGVAKDEIIKAVEKEIGQNSTHFEIEQKITQFISYFRFRTCLGIFTKLMLSIGHKDLRTLYIEVGKELNTPAAKLVSFTINSYYNTISINELTNLANEFKDNVVALQILRARAKSYIYNKNPDHKTKAKIISALNLSIGPTKIPLKQNKEVSLRGKNPNIKRF